MRHISTFDNTHVLSQTKKFLFVFSKFIQILTSLKKHVKNIKNRINTLLIPEQYGIKIILK